MLEKSKPVRGRVAGVDFGTVRIGVAIADLDVGIASPFETYRRSGEQADARYFSRLANQEAIMRFVVGLPVHLDGHESQKSAEARQFGAWLAEVTGVAVVFFDERFTSVEAEAHLERAGLTKKRRQARRDMVAAQVMLAAYLESGRQGQDDPGAIDD